jgi:hypothetical protein
MHNCREVKERLIEMVLDGVDCAAELDGCADCRTEFAALNATLRMTRRISENTPDDNYWNGYHARLREKISTAEESSHAKAQRREEGAKKNRASDLRFLFAPLRLSVRTAVRVPVPLVVLTILAFATLGLFAARAARRPPVQTQVVVHVPVEVPVVQEKVVTRVVYRERRSSLRNSQRANNEARVESTFARSRKSPDTEIPPSLTGFKPADDVKLVVIKGGTPYEK